MLLSELSSSICAAKLLTLITQLACYSLKLLDAQRQAGIGMTACKGLHVFACAKHQAELH
jgi:hypothetical protein